MKKDKFSVLMSVYKKDNPKYVEESIESILNQTLLPNQIVIIADGLLTDELYAVLHKYENKSLFDIYYRNENLGLGLTLKEGIEYCKNDIIARMDSDDKCHNDRFAKQIVIFSNNKDIDLVGTNIDEYDEEMKNKLSTRKVPEMNDDIKKFAKKRNPFNHMSVMYKKKAIINAGNYEDCPLFEDYYLWCKMIMNNCNFYNIQEALLDVRTGTGMIDRRGGYSYLKKIINFQKKIKKIGMINTYEYCLNVMIRGFVAIVPSKCRRIIYMKKLRKD